MGNASAPTNVDPQEESEGKMENKFKEKNGTSSSHHHMKHEHEQQTSPEMPEHVHHEMKSGDMHDNTGSEGQHEHHAKMVRDLKLRFLFSSIITVPILLLSPMIQMFLGLSWRFSGDSLLLFCLSTVLYFYGGKPFLVGVRDELNKKSPAMMTLIAFAITVSYLYSSLTLFVIKGNDFFWELATLIVIMLLGHWIEMKSVMGASKALDELAKLLPEKAHRIEKNGETADVPVGQLVSGDAVLVKPGERIPIDGIVFDGMSDVNESMMTGESNPVEKQKDDEVIGGSINGTGVIKYRVNKVGEQTYLSSVIKLVREAQASKSNTQRLADTAAKWLFYIAMAAGLLTFIVWGFGGHDLNFAIERAVTVIVICCPHALGLAIPLVVAVSTGIAAKSGLLIKNRAAFENARKVNAVVFDKTGTLTKGEFGITDIAAIGISEHELLSIVFSAELNSEHPIGKGIVKEGQKRNLKPAKVENFQNLPGTGLKALIDGKDILVVNPGYVKKNNIAFDEQKYEELSAQGKTVVFVLEKDRLLGYLALTDIIRESAKQTIEKLKQMNITTIMLTGDNKRVAGYVGRILKLDTVIAEVLPQEKASKIDALRKEKKVVAMTGDGVNDAPSLAKADLGIAIGAGTDVAIETADIILVKSNPEDVINIIRLSKAVYRKMIQNLIWATGYNAVALPLAAGVLYAQGIVLSPAIGALFMSLSTIVVAVNARLLKIVRA
jgi:Cu2+-exporting ATPase